MNTPTHSRMLHSRAAYCMDAHSLPQMNNTQPQTQRHTHTHTHLHHLSLRFDINTMPLTIRMRAAPDGEFKPNPFKKIVSLSSNELLLHRLTSNYCCFPYIGTGCCIPIVVCTIPFFCSNSHFFCYWTRLTRRKKQNYKNGINLMMLLLVLFHENKLM